MGRAIGVDYHHYVEAASLVEWNLSQALSLTGGSRPMIFLLISGFQRVHGSDVSVAVKFLPVLLNPLVVLSVFFWRWRFSVMMGLRCGRRFSRCLGSRSLLACTRISWPICWDCH